MRQLQPLPEGARAPLARDGSGACCFDCASADTLVGMMGGAVDFGAARICIANDRQEQYRLPGIPRGLVGARLMRPSSPGDLERHHAWIDAAFGPEWLTD